MIEETLFDKPFPVIVLEKSIMRPINVASDVINFYHYISDKEVGKYIASEDLPKDIKSAQYELSYWANLFEHKQSVFWGIEDKETHQLIGTIGYNFWNKEHNKAEISYDLAKPHWGKGIMTEAIKHMIRFGTDNMELRRIAATVSVENTASIRVLEKVGFKKEGCMKDYKVVHGHYHDFDLYAIISHI